VRLAVSLVLFLAACAPSESDLRKRSFELCHEKGGQMMLFTPVPEITAFELAQLLSEITGDLRPPVCVKPDNHVPDIVAKFFRPVDRH
jgi:hypothetical protein